MKVFKAISIIPTFLLAFPHKDYDISFNFILFFFESSM